ncbi:hypothetical protein AMJ80_09465 [bacterium SM23_31]|nr:MAG: hypothetical protein AMJ80_09465 [bacterium SM23_31]
MTGKAKAVFLDRDGTISYEIGFIDRVEDFKLYPYSAESLAALRSMDFKIVIVTNQSGIARGFFQESRVMEINDRMHTLLKNEGVTIDGIYYCPHSPEGIVAEYVKECTCRKPDIGMIKKAETELNLDLSSSIIVGDKLTDIECGHNAGLKTVLIRTGYGKDEEKKLGKSPTGVQPDVILDTLKDVVEWIKNEKL